MLPISPVRTSGFGGSSVDIRNGTFSPLPTSTPTPTANHVRCYRLQFGAYEPSSTRKGLEEVTSAVGDSYPTASDRCGDFETFEELAQEVDDAITLLRDRHKNARIVLIGLSRGGLAGRLFLQRAGMTENKRAVVGLLTTSSPHLGSRLGRIYAWLDANKRGAPGTDADDWEVVDFLRNQPDESLDVRRPTIGDLADNSGSIASLNTQSAISQLPAKTTYGEIINAGTEFGKLAVINWYPDYTVFGPGITPGMEQVSSAAEAYILDGTTIAALQGDGIVSAASQVFTGPVLGRIVTRRIVSSEVLHADATHRVVDIRAELATMRSSWFPGP